MLACVISFTLHVATKSHDHVCSTSPLYSKIAAKGDIERHCIRRFRMKMRTWRGINCAYVINGIVTLSVYGLFWCKPGPSTHSTSPEQVFLPFHLAGTIDQKVALTGSINRFLKRRMIPC